MIRLPLLSAFTLAALLADGLHAQTQSCPGGRADGDGIGITSRLAAHPSRAAEIVDSVLVEAGYVIRFTPAGEGEWNIVPRFTFVEGLKEEMFADVDHPGVRVGVSSRLSGDSVEIEITAQTLCRTMRDGEPDDEAETSIELVHAVMLIGALEERVEALQAAGADLSTPVERPGRYTLQAPDSVAGFRRIGRHDYDDPAAGINVRYGRDDGSYVDIYVYPGTPPECDVACGTRYVNEEADGFIQAFPRMVEAGTYGRMELRADETLPVPAGAPWLFGRRLVMEVELRDQAQESQYYLFAFPGYKVKVRATFPPSAEMTAAVQSFVDTLLPMMVSGS